LAPPLCQPQEEFKLPTKSQDIREHSILLQGAANLLLGNFPEALHFYRDAVATRPDPWQLESMYLQALETARQLRNEQVAADLAQTFNKTLE
jgi:hypothetical protein